MNISNLRELGNVTLNVSVDDLNEFALTIANNIIEGINNMPKGETYLTPEETMKELNVCRTTLWDWNKKGMLVAHKVGRKVMYKLSEIRALQNA